jgi:cytochrome P450
MTEPDEPLSLFRLLDPDVLANPYPLYAELRESAPVHWDPYLHAWVVTRYRDVVQVFQQFLAGRTPTPEKLAELGLGQLNPIARVMVRQMLFLDPPAHGRVRGIAAVAFTARRVAHLRERIQELVDGLVDAVAANGHMDVMADIANPMPSMVTAELLGVPLEDHEQLKDWSQTFAEMLGNFQHNPGRSARVLAAVEEMTAYFRSAVRKQASSPTEGLVHALATATVDGDRLDEEEVIANIIVTMVGGLETTTNLIGNGLLTLLRQPAALEQLRSQPELVPSAVEELLRYESPSQHTARLAPADVMLGGQLIRERQAVIAVMGAANRDPERFPDPDRLDLTRTDNRHVAFAWAAHFCFGAPLARLEGQIAFETLLRRLPGLRLADEATADPGGIQWRPNLGLRGVVSLPVSFTPTVGSVPAQGPAAAALRA